MRNTWAKSHKYNITKNKNQIHKIDNLFLEFSDLSGPKVWWSCRSDLKKSWKMHVFSLSVASILPRMSRFRSAPRAQDLVLHNRSTELHAPLTTLDHCPMQARPCVLCRGLQKSWILPVAGAVTQHATWTMSEVLVAPNKKGRELINRASSTRECNDPQSVPVHTLQEFSRMLSSRTEHHGARHRLR